MQLSCVTIDDEYLALRILEQYIKQSPSLNLLAQFTDPHKGLTFLNQHQPQLLLLDIQMPGIDGLDFVRRLSYNPIVIFTTARQDFAVHAYELGVIDYLVKPIEPARFEKAIGKALQYHNTGQLLAKEKNVAAFLPIKTGYQSLNIAFDQIIYIEGWNEYIKIHTKSAQYTTLVSLKQIASTLPATDFIRVHKSFIVAIRCIISFNTAQITLFNKEIIPIGRLYKNDFLQAMRTNS